MSHVHAAMSATSAQAVPPEIIAHLATPSTDDFPTVAGARRGFEGLILNRGRPREADEQFASAPYGQAVTAAPTSNVTPIRIGVAESAEQIEAASRLICKRYSWRGYRLEAFDLQCAPTKLDKARREITFFVADPEATLGTITLRLDGPEGLRADATHEEAMARARGGDRRIGELTRLAVAEGVDSRFVLASLFGLVYTVGRVRHGVSDVYIEVNPRHVVFYVRALGFIVAGSAQFCERVRAPSVLLHLEVDALERRLGLGTACPAEEPLKRYGT